MTKGETMSESITLPKGEYDLLKKKAALFDHYVETETLTKGELVQIREALKGPSLSKAEFLKRHPHLA